MSQTMTLQQMIRGVIGHPRNTENTDKCDIRVPYVVYLNKEVTIKVSGNILL